MTLLHIGYCCGVSPAIYLDLPLLVAAAATAPLRAKHLLTLCIGDLTAGLRHQFCCRVLPAVHLDVPLLLTAAPASPLQIYARAWRMHLCLLSFCSLSLLISVGLCVFPAPTLLCQPFPHLIVSIVPVEKWFWNHDHHHLHLCVWPLRGLTFC